MSLIVEITGLDNHCVVLANIHDVTFRDHAHKQGTGVAAVRRYKGVEASKSGWTRESTTITQRRIELFETVDFEVPVKAVVKREDGGVVNEWWPTERPTTPEERLRNLARALGSTPLDDGLKYKISFLTGDKRIEEPWRYASPLAPVEPIRKGYDPEKHIYWDRDGFKRIHNAFVKLRDGKASSINVNAWIESLQKVLTRGQ